MHAHNKCRFTLGINFGEWKKIVYFC